MPEKYRILFSKTGRAAYISHLDLMHTMQRAFSRAGYSLKYSEGFNPHPFMSIALPLSVGCESVCEIMDVTVNEGLPECGRLNAALPEGIEITEIYRSDRKISELRYLAIEAEFDYDGDVFEQKSIIVSKKSKKGGFVDTDIRPMIRELSIVNGFLKAVICAQEPTLNPQYLTQAAGLDFVRYRRVEVYDSEMKVFR